jgi:ribonuclease VapC
MIVDSSAVVAVLNQETGWQAFDQALREASGSQMSAATYVELGVVVDSMGDPSISRRLDRLLSAWGVDVVPLTAAQAGLARAAYRDYGRGCGHPARLNLGDCFAYALAADTGRALLFKGDDFGHTDVIPALPAINRSKAR